MRAVVLDTNALMMPYQFGINIEKELNRLLGICRIIVPRTVVEEMEKLAEEGGEVGRAAKLGLSIIRKRGFRLVETESKGDEGVLETAIKMDAAIVTNDKELKKKAKELRLPIIYLREGCKLEMEEIL
ncbi:MAG: twitching motility protein PilT [Thermoplasmata archaeon]|nr:MAG: twitching motility protein PilT [Thermoplasmata archaeon]HDN95803.1 twitching motility protein PilT [Thermoplasmatales archaeon]